MAQNQNQKQIGGGDDGNGGRRKDWSMLRLERIRANIDYFNRTNGIEPASASSCRNPPQKRTSVRNSGASGNVPANPGLGNLRNKWWSRTEERCLFELWTREELKGKVNLERFFSLWEEFRTSRSANEQQTGGFSHRTARALYQRQRELKKDGWRVDDQGMVHAPLGRPGRKYYERI